MCFMLINTNSNLQQLVSVFDLPQVHSLQLETALHIQEALGIL